MNGDLKMNMVLNRNKIKVLVAKPGLDGHDRGARVLCRFLRDSGYEVIYTGLHKTAEEVANAALQEDVDVLGMSFLSGAHESYVPRILDILKKNGVDLNDMVILVGGTIPEEQFKKMIDLGVDGVFIPGAPMDEISDFIDLKIKEKRDKSSDQHHFVGTKLIKAEDLV